MKPRKVRRTDTNQPSSFEPYYRRQAGADRKQPWRKWLVRIFRISVLVTIVLLVTIWGLKLETLKVRDTVYDSEIKETANSLIANNRGWSNLLTLPVQQLASELQARHNEAISDVKIRKNWLSRAITISVTDRSPQLLWQVNNQLFTLDQTGRVIAQVGERPPNLALVLDTSNVAVELNQQAVPAQFINFSKEIFSDLAAGTGLTPTQGRIEQTTNELFVDTSQGFFIRFDTTGDSQEQIAAVKLTMAQAGSQPITSYIDVRLPYKLFYR